MDLRINDESGRPLLYELDVDTTIRGFDLVLHASGGSSRGLPGHNPDYIKALEILLGRLRGLNADIDGLWFALTVVSIISHDQRVVHASSYGYTIPIHTVVDNK